MFIPFLGISTSSLPQTIANSKLFPQYGGLSATNDTAKNFYDVLNSISLVYEPSQRMKETSATLPT